MRAETTSGKVAGHKEEYMKFTKILGIAAFAALALMAFASSASATTLEVKGVTTLEPVTIEASSSAALLSDTFGLSQNKCASTVKGTTNKRTSSSTYVEGPISSLTFTSCEREGVVVHKAGTLKVDWISGTTNGTVFSEGAEVTTPSPGGTLNCKTSTTSPGTDIGTLTGSASKNATMTINASLNCGSITAKWTGTYTVTSPLGLGVEG
jgi:hypothetical protein